MSLDTVKPESPLEAVLLALPLKVAALDADQWAARRRREQILRELEAIETELAGKVAAARTDDGKPAYRNEDERAARLQESLKAHELHKALKSNLWDVDDVLARVQREAALAEDEQKNARVLGLLRSGLKVGSVV